MPCKSSNILSRALKSIPTLVVLFGTIISYGLDELGVVGPVEPARSYYEQFLLKSKDQIGNDVILVPKDQAQIDRWTAQHQFYDSGLTVGSFLPLRITQHADRLVQPQCLVANDEVSVKWLRDHESQLVQIKPVCYLVRTTTPADLNTLQKTFSALLFVAVNPQYLIKTYSIPHYPALISRKGIEQ